MSLTLPPLPYALDALEPHVSRATLAVHHGRHHAAYVDKARALVQGTALESAALEDIVTTIAAAFFAVFAASFAGFALLSPRSVARTWLGVSALVLSLASYIALTWSVLGVEGPHPITAILWMVASSCGGGVLLLEHEAFTGLSAAPKATVLGALASTVLAVMLAA